MINQRFQRYAIYWTPVPETPLAEFGALWFGGFDTCGLSAGFAALATKIPSIYGLHATFKAPFRLKEDVTPFALQEALQAFCANRKAPATGRLTLGGHQHYLTMVLKEKEADVDWLATEIVTKFDQFRAPLTDRDRKSREIEDMTPRQAALLERFGYPYVLSDFRFHISLAGPLSEPELDEVTHALAPRLEPLLNEPLQIEGLTLLGEPEDAGVFQPISRHLFRR